MTLKFRNDVHLELLADGFSLIKSTDILMTQSLKQSLGELIATCHYLPADSYCEERTRFRRLSRFTFLPWQGRLVLSPPVPYQQSNTLNPDANGAARKFASLTPQMAHNKFLHQLIRADFSVLPFDAADIVYPFDCGVHIVRMEARPDADGSSSPDCLHKDGEPFTFVHLLQREDVIGGESVIADNDKNILFEATLCEPLDSIVVRDEAVYHQVRRVKVLEGKARGIRTALLIDFTPMKPTIQMPLAA
jgi:hypothetical protein